MRQRSTIIKTIFATLSEIVVLHQDNVCVCVWGGGGGGGLKTPESSVKLISFSNKVVIFY